MKNFSLSITMLMVMLMRVVDAYKPATLQKNSLYCVILAGGSGERLWPLSRAEKPKQLLPVTNVKTLLDQSIDRAKLLVPAQHIWISTTQQHALAISALVGNSVGRVMVEPGARNTAPAILLNCLEIYKKDPEALILFLPADSFIASHDYAKFAGYLEHVYDFVSQHNRITLLGVKPTFAATGYGYIEYEPNAAQMPFNIKTFHEKPSLAVAERYLQLPTMLWNIGIFGAKASVFIDEFKKLAPEIAAAVIAYHQGLINYDDIPADSIDYAVIEKSKDVSVLPVDFAWCDVGNITVFLSLKEQQGALVKDRVIEIESKNNLVDVPNKLVALVGMNDICVVETERALLITKRDDAEKVRAVVKALKQGNLTEYL